MLGVTDANTCLRWLGRDQPDLAEAREAASRIIKDATRADEIISRVRMLFQKGTPQEELVDVNEVIRGMIVLLRSRADHLLRSRADHLLLEDSRRDLLICLSNGDISGVVLMSGPAKQGLRN
jgi:hypothetical protein